MVVRHGSAPPDVDEEPLEDEVADDVDGSAPRRAPSLDGLSLAGLTRRRLGWLVAAFLSAWILVVFARQVADTAAKAAEADRARASNAQVALDVASLQRELWLIQQQSFITQQAHGQGLGIAKDHAFVLAPDAPPIANDAPGSAAVRIGGQPDQQTPLDSWLSILFGPPGD